MSSKLLHPVKGWLPHLEMVWLPCPHLRSCPGPECYSEAPTCHVKRLAELSPKYLWTYSCLRTWALLEYLWGSWAEARWELWMGHGGMRSTAHLGWRWWHRTGADTAGSWLHLFAVPSLLSSNNSYWLKRTYQRMQLSSAMGDLCEFPSPPQFTIWAFIKGLCPLIVKPETLLMHRGIKSLWKQPTTFHVIKCKENFYAWASQSLY